jgi:hypothetical protein
VERIFRRAEILPDLTIKSDLDWNDYILVRSPMGTSEITQ